MTLEAMLHNGKEIKCKIPVTELSVEVSDRLPLNHFKTNLIFCPRCKKHEFALFKEKFRYICFCLDSKCLAQDKDAGTAEARKRREKDEERNKHGLPLSGAEKFQLGRVYHDAELSQWIASKEDMIAATSWLNNNKPFLVLLGIPGTGKTYLAAALLNYLFKKKEEVIYTTHRRFIEEIHYAMQDGKTQHSVINRYYDKKFLILDDLGSATCSEWQQEMILELIDRRYSSKVKTIITSNFTPKEMRQKLSDRTASRILDSGNEILEFLTTDRRTDKKYQEEEKWWEKE